MARRHRLAPGDPDFLTKHPTPLWLVVQVSTSKVNLNSFPTTPPDKESKRIEVFGKQMFSLANLAIRSINAVCWADLLSPTGTWPVRSCQRSTKSLGPHWVKPFRIVKMQHNMSLGLAWIIMTAWGVRCALGSCSSATCGCDPLVFLGTCRFL